MTKISLTQKEKETVLSILKEYAPSLPIWAFGSRVEMTNRKTSDLDIAIINDVSLPVKKKAALREAFSESNLPFRVDVVEWSGISDTFKEIIKKNYVILK